MKGLTNVRKLGTSIVYLATLLVLGGCASSDSSKAMETKVEMDAEAAGGQQAPLAQTEVDKPSYIVESTTMKTNILHDWPEVPEEEREVQNVDHYQKDILTQMAEADPGSPQYRIGARDVLEFRSFDDPTLSSEITVRFDGYISLPLIEDIFVLNRSRDETTDAVKEAYRTVFRDPQISVVIRQSASRYYTVMGEVQTPREYPYGRPISLLDAINSAGGLRINNRSGDTFVGSQGQITKALIIRHGKGGINSPGGERQVFEYNLENLSSPGAHASDAPVYPGDIVYVPEGVNLVYLIGEVRSPSVYQLSQDMDLLQLLARAGGPSFSSARLGSVVLMREIDPENSRIMILDVNEMLKTGARLRMKPGDVIYVPRKRMIRLQEFVTRFTGTISPVLSLYTQAYNAAYESQRIDRLYGDDAGTGANDLAELLSLLQGLQNVIPTP